MYLNVCFHYQQDSTVLFFTALIELVERCKSLSLEITIKSTRF